MPPAAGGLRPPDPPNGVRGEGANPRITASISPEIGGQQIADKPFSFALWATTGALLKCSASRDVPQPCSRALRRPLDGRDRTQGPSDAASPVSAQP